MNRIVAVAFVAIATFSICSPSGLSKLLADGPAKKGADKPSSGKPLAEKPLPRSEKIKFKGHDGKTAFSIKLREDGAKLVDGDEKELARYTHSDRKLKIKDAEDKVLGYVVQSGEKLRLEGPDQKAELFALQRQSDGEWKLEGPDHVKLNIIKHRDYGAEVEDADNHSLFKVKSKSGKTSLRNAKDQSVYSTDDALSADAMACLGLEKVTDIRLRAAFVFAVDHFAKK